MRLAILLLAIALSTAACSIYRVDVQQGNIVERTQLEKLKVGMERGQVRFLLGTPLVADPFHDDRWDYVYSRNYDATRTDLRRVTVYFENDVVARIDTSAYDLTTIPRTKNDRGP